MALKTITEFTVEYILHLIGVQDSHQIEVNGKHYEFGLSSVRLRTFKKNSSCYRCGMAGVKFLLQQTEDTRSDGGHINLYGVDEDGGLVLMTKDHIHPKSKGGSNALFNMQTMCERCNMMKGSTVGIFLVRRKYAVGEHEEVVKAFSKKKYAVEFIHRLVKWNKEYWHIAVGEAKHPNNYEAFKETIPVQFRQYFSAATCSYEIEEMEMD